MTYEFTTHEVPPMTIVSIRDEVAIDDFPAFLGSAFPELYGYVGRHGVAATGHPFVIYHAVGPVLIDAEVCVPVVGAAPVDGRIAPRPLPGTTVVRTLHVGRYETLASAYAALADWVAVHDFLAAGPIRERYLIGAADDVDPAAYRTELDRPIRARDVSTEPRPRRMPVAVR